MEPQRSIHRSVEELQQLAYDIRRDVVQMLYAAGSGHLGGSMSCADILATLYGELLNIDPSSLNSPGRDRFVLSIGHVAPAYYAALVECNFIPKSEIYTLRQLESPLQGHPKRTPAYGIESGSGSLGQGLSIGLGFALAARLSNLPTRAVVLMGDGELQEGQVWEAAMAAAHHRADNLIAVVDWNGVQIDGPTNAVMSLGQLAAKWQAFGWNVIEVDGHSIPDLLLGLGAAMRTDNANTRPTIVLARTIMGCGIKEIEGDHTWHGKVPTSDTVDVFLAALEQSHNARMQGKTIYTAENRFEYTSKRGGQW